MKNWAVAGFYVFLTIGLAVFVLNYGFTDWEQVANEFDEATTELVKSIHCEIEYKDFHYKGLCMDRDEVFDFALNITTG